MRQEKILEHLNLAISYIQETENIDPVAFQHLLTAIKGVEENIRDISNKESGCLCRAKAAEKVIQSAKAKGLDGAWMEGGLQCVSDGIRGYRFPQKINLPNLKAEGHPNISSFLDTITECEPIIELPRSKVVRAENKLYRLGLPRNSKHDGIWRLKTETKEVYVNAVYLAEVIEAMGQDVSAFLPKNNTRVVIFKAKDGSDAFLCEMNYDKEKQGPALLNR